MAAITGTDLDDLFGHAVGDDVFDGLGGIDTVSYAAANGPVTASLQQATAEVAAPPAEALRIMPVGASLTRGLNASETVPITENGGYRTELFKLFEAAGIPLNYVGSLSTGGSPELPDNQHEGVRGVEIDYFLPIIGERIEIFNPDVVTLLVGTNDARATDTAEVMVQQLGALMDAIAGHPYRPKLIVATLPPIDPANPTNTPEAIAKIAAYNAAIPDLVAQKQAAGLDVHLADMGALTLEDISDVPLDAGLHATPAGYAKMAGIWFQALSASGALAPRSVDPGGVDGFAGIENLTGSAFADTLGGDAGPNVLTGLGGGDVLRGEAGDDELLGGAGNDQLFGGPGANVMDGGQGNDRATYEGARAAFSVTGSVTDLRVSGAGVADALTGVEELRFTDGRLVYDATAFAADVWRLHDAAFNAAPDEAALNGPLSQYPSNTPLIDIARAFTLDPRFAGTYGVLPDDQFVAQLYRDVLSREPTPEEIQAQLDALGAGATRADILLSVGDSAENVERVRPIIEAGIWDPDNTAPPAAATADGFWLG